MRFREPKRFGGSVESGDGSESAQWVEHAPGAAAGIEDRELGSLCGEALDESQGDTFHAAEPPHVVFDFVESSIFVLLHSSESITGVVPPRS